MKKPNNLFNYKVATKLAATIVLSTASISWAGRTTTAAAAPTPPAQSVTWGHIAINATAATAWTVNSGAGVKVCVLDTGVQKDHADLQANILGGINYVGSATGNTNWSDAVGHGTHIAGIIAAVDNTIGSKGVAYDAKLLIVKVLPNNLIGDPDVVAKGVDYCRNNGAHIINMSFAMAAGSSALQTAIVNAYNAGIDIVAGVGDNSTGGTANVLYPAKYPEVIAVSSMQQNSLNNWALSFFSNFSPTGAGEVDYIAPGTIISGLWNASGYAHSASGTGQAAAFVSGVAALRRSSGSLGLVGKDVLPVALTPEKQGTFGLIDALLTVNHR